MVVPITHAPKGCIGRVIWVASSSTRRQKLYQLGFSPDARVECLFHTPHNRYILCRTERRKCLLKKKTANEIFIELIDRTKTSA